MLTITLLAQALAADGTHAAGAGGQPPFHDGRTPPSPGTEAAEARALDLAAYARVELARARRTARLGAAGLPLSLVVLGSVAARDTDALTPPAALLLGTSAVAFALSPWLAAAGAARERDALAALGCEVPRVPLGRVGQGAYAFGAATGMLLTASPSDALSTYAALGSTAGFAGAWTLGTWEHLRLERAFVDCPMVQ